MSWGTSFETRDAFKNDTPASPVDQSVPGVKEQYEAARTAAEGLLASGVVGDDSREMRVYLSGHANPNHAPTSGMVNDSITVNVSQK